MTYQVFKHDIGRYYYAKIQPDGSHFTPPEWAPDCFRATRGDAEDALERYLESKGQPMVVAFDLEGGAVVNGRLRMSSARVKRALEAASCRRRCDCVDCQVRRQHRERQKK